MQLVEKGRKGSCEAPPLALALLSVHMRFRQELKQLMRSWIDGGYEWMDTVWISIFSADFLFYLSLHNTGQYHIHPPCNRHHLYVDGHWGCGLYRKHLELPMSGSFVFRIGFFWSWGEGFLTHYCIHTVVPWWWDMGCCPPTHNCYLIIYFVCTFG